MSKVLVITHCRLHTQARIRMSYIRCGRAVIDRMRVDVSGYPVVSDAPLYFTDRMASLFRLKLREGTHYRTD